MTDTDRIVALQQEIAGLKRALVDHPTAQAFRFCAPLIRDAIAKGVWPHGPGVESVEHEVRAALAWLDRFEREATQFPEIAR